jgi:hypothetical protein
VPVLRSIAKPFSLSELSTQARVIASAVGAFMVRVKLVVFVTPPPIADTVTADVPTGVDPVVLIVNVEEQVGLQLAEEREAVAPDGKPITE